MKWLTIVAILMFVGCGVDSPTSEPTETPDQPYQPVPKPEVATGPKIKDIIQGDQVLEFYSKPKPIDKNTGLPSHDDADNGIDKFAGLIRLEEIDLEGERVILRGKEDHTFEDIEFPIVINQSTILKERLDKKDIAKDDLVEIRYVPRKNEKLHYLWRNFRPKNNWRNERDRVLSFAKWKKYRGVATQRLN